ncbi:MAG: SDR family oxidoreductase, partial [Actinobacteria bacterium]|nr:SDR family oxidoreductase [Actinomycetota bacterium]
MLLGRGARVAATDVDAEALRSHAGEAAWPADRVRLERLDVTDPAEWKRVAGAAVDAWDGLDVV